MTSRTRAVVLVLVVVLCLVLTEQIARGLGIERAVGSRKATRIVISRM
jgi:hypothetical protein